MVDATAWDMEEEEIYDEDEGASLNEVVKL